MSSIVARSGLPSASSSQHAFDQTARYIAQNSPNEIRWFATSPVENCASHSMHRPPQPGREVEQRRRPSGEAPARRCRALRPGSTLYPVGGIDELEAAVEARVLQHADAAVVLQLGERILAGRPRSFTYCCSVVEARRLRRVDVRLAALRRRSPAGSASAAAPATGRSAWLPSSFSIGSTAASRRRRRRSGRR